MARERNWGHLQRILRSHVPSEWVILFTTNVANASTRRGFCGLHIVADNRPRSTIASMSHGVLHIPEPGERGIRVPFGVLHADDAELTGKCTILTENHLHSSVPASHATNAENIGMMGPTGRDEDERNMRRIRLLESILPSPSEQETPQTMPVVSTRQSQTSFLKVDLDVNANRAYAFANLGSTPDVFGHESTTRMPYAWTWPPASFRPKLGAIRRDHPRRPSAAQTPESG